MKTRQNPVLLTVSELNTEAVKYCGTVPEEGAVQLEILQSLGCAPYHMVLEVGCGALVAGIPIMHSLEKGHYTGVDPNRWLSDDTLSIPENRAIADEKQLHLLVNSCFMGGLRVAIQGHYTYILSHSVMAHASIEQLKLFLKETSYQLRHGGKLIFSLCLATPTQPETISDTWQYPGSVFVNKERLVQYATPYFREIEEHPEYKTQIMAVHESSNHDWFVLTK